MEDYMSQIQSGARVTTSPEDLKKYYRECISVLKEKEDVDGGGLQKAITYVDCCIKRLDSDPTAFDALREPPIFSLPNGMLAHTDGKGGISVIG